MIGDEHVDLEDLWAGSIGERFGKTPKFPIEDMIPQAVRGPGVCAGMATANTMHCVVEALGMCIPGSAPVRANSEKMFDKARAAGARIVEMVHEDLRPRRILTEAAFRNAAAMTLAVSGSINAIKHLQATAVEAGTDVDLFEIWEEMGRKVPVLTAVRPNGPVRIEGFEDAGGAAAMLKRLAPVIDTEAMTCTGKTLAAVIADTPEGDTAIIRPLDAPISEGPSIVILKGSLAPASAVVKLGIRDPKRPERFEGRARVFDQTVPLLAEIEARTLEKGDVVILRGQGPKGGPAMGGGASLVLFAIDAAGLARDVAFVTDGQLSGLCLKGLTIAEVSPEAVDGGPLGKVRDGDTVLIDVPARRLDVLVDAAEFTARPNEAQPLSAHPTGYLDLYRRGVQPMAKGTALVQEPARP